MKNEDDTSGKRLRFHSHNGPISIDIDRILFLKGYRSYTEVYLEGENTVVSVTHNLNFMETVLKDEFFLRCHKSWLVSVQRIISFYLKERLVIIAGYGVPVSRRKWKNTISILCDRGIKSVKIINPGIKNLRLT